MSSEGGQSPNRRGKRLALNSMGETDEDLGLLPESGAATAGGENTVLWERFEGVAFAVTKLYRNPSWPVFQQAAASTTEFYKESVDAHKRGLDSGIALGRQLLCKELLSWLQSSSHPFVRRDEFINALLGRTVPPDGAANVGVPPYDYRQQSRCHGNNAPASANHAMTPAVVSGDLEIFQEALNSPPGLTAFFVEECRRHAKRRTTDDNGGDSAAQDVWNKKRIRRT